MHVSTISARNLIVALMLVAAMPSLASDAPNTNPPAALADQELEEIVVTGRRAREQRPDWEELQRPFNWLARLVGRFVVEGHVDLRGLGNPADFVQVQGRTECVGFGVAPGVQCELKIRWPEQKQLGSEVNPGTFPNLNPAVLLYGYEPAEPGIRYILVDSKGIAESAAGLLITADTMRSRSPCKTLPGECERVVHITARPDFKTVEMQIDLEVDHRKALSYVFMMNRVPGTPSVVFGRKK